MDLSNAVHSFGTVIDHLENGQTPIMSYKQKRYKFGADNSWAQITHSTITLFKQKPTAIYLLSNIKCFSYIDSKAKTFKFHLPAMAARIGMSLSTVYRNFRMLVEQNIIKIISASEGYYTVTVNDLEKMRGFLQIPEWVLKRLYGKPYAFGVYVGIKTNFFREIINQRKSDNDVFCVPLRLIAEKTGFSQQTILKHKETLKMLGIIYETKQGGRKSNIYNVSTVEYKAVEYMKKYTAGKKNIQAQKEIKSNINPETIKGKNKVVKPPPKYHEAFTKDTIEEVKKLYNNSGGSIFAGKVLDTKYDLQDQINFEVNRIKSILESNSIKITVRGQLSTPNKALIRIKVKCKGN